MTEKIEITLDEMKRLYGSLDTNIRFIEKELNVRAVTRENGVEISGEDAAVEEAVQLVKSLIKIILKGEELDRARIKQSMEILRSDCPAALEEINNDTVTVTAKGRHIKCKTLGQREYVKAIKNSTVVFGIGPAGTGKTYLAVALAYCAFKANEIERIILTRPALEAGEKLGFLPGDLQDKVDPYLRPLYDALSEMFGLENYQRLLERGAIEVAPLAYMRGRTLNNAYIILDEAQNSTKEQMKMFLTRLGTGSKMIISGDVTQIDLPTYSQSGLKHAANLLKDLEDIAVITLTEKDIVRHELVQRIVQAYAKQDKQNQG